MRVLPQISPWYPGEDIRSRLRGRGYLARVVIACRLALHLRKRERALGLAYAMEPDKAIRTALQADIRALRQAARGLQAYADAGFPRFL